MNKSINSDYGYFYIVNIVKNMQISTTEKLEIIQDIIDKGFNVLTYEGSLALYYACILNEQELILCLIKGHKVYLSLFQVCDIFYHTRSRNLLKLLIKYHKYSLEDVYRSICEGISYLAPVGDPNTNMYKKQMAFEYKLKQYIIYLSMKYTYKDLKI